MTAQGRPHVSCIPLEAALTHPRMGRFQTGQFQSARGPLGPACSGDDAKILASPYGHHSGKPAPPLSPLHQITLPLRPLSRSAPSACLATASSQTRLAAAWPASAGDQSTLPTTHQEEHGDIEKAVGRGVARLAFQSGIRIRNHDLPLSMFPLEQIGDP